MVVVVLQERARVSRLVDVCDTSERPENASRRSWAAAAAAGKTPRLDGDGRPAAAAGSSRRRSPLIRRTRAASPPAYAIRLGGGLREKTEEFNRLCARRKRPDEPQYVLNLTQVDNVR